MSRFTFLVSIPLSSSNNSLFVLVKLQVLSLTLIVNILNLSLVVIIDQILLMKTLPIFFKPSRKAKMIVRIYLFKSLQNGIENPIEFLEELSWAYRQKHKVDKLNDQEEKKNYISKIHQLFF